MTRNDGYPSVFRWRQRACLIVPVLLLHKRTVLPNRHVIELSWVGLVGRFQVVACARLMSVLDTFMCWAEALLLLVRYDTQAHQHDTGDLSKR